MMKRIKTLLFMMVMALAVLTWAGWSPAMAAGEADDTAVEETVGQEEWSVEKDGSNQAAEEEWNNQEESSHTN